VQRLKGQLNEDASGIRYGKADAREKGTKDDENKAFSLRREK